MIEHMLCKLNPVELRPRDRARANAWTSGYDAPNPHPDRANRPTWSRLSIGFSRQTPAQSISQACALRNPRLGAAAYASS